FKQRHRGRRRRIRQHVSTRFINSVFFHTGKHGNRLVRVLLVLDGRYGSRARISSRASANGIYHYKYGSLLFDGGINFIGGLQFFKAYAGKLIAHRRYQVFWIHCFVLSVSLTQISSKDTNPISGKQIASFSSLSIFSPSLSSK